MSLDKEQRIYSASVPLYTGESNACILRPVEGGFLIVFVFTPSKLNISIFICPSSTHLPKNYSQVKKKLLEGHMPPPPPNYD
jgi:hypothetical protein